MAIFREKTNPEIPVVIVFAFCLFQHKKNTTIGWNPIFILF